MKYLIIFLIAMGLLSCTDEDIFFPEVTTETVTDITGNSASFNGTLQSLGSSPIIELGFEYSENAIQQLNGDGTRIPVDGNFNAVPTSFSYAIENLQPNAEYFVRAYATTTNGTIYGDTVTFRTLAN